MPFNRETYRQDKNTYVADYGYPKIIKRGDAEFADVDAEFGAILSIGKTAVHSMDQEGWEIVDGCPLLELCKERKYEDVKQVFNKTSSTAVVASALGFDVDANSEAQRRISGIVTDMSAKGVANVSFCDADNKFHDLTLDQVKALQLEVVEYEQRLLQRKWNIRAAIEKAATFDALNAVTVSFDNV